jgi:hypothetical protein
MSATDDRCQDCGQHVADPHAPGCPRNDVPPVSRLVEFGRTLVEAGFEVWHTQSGYRDEGWLTYRDPANNCWGTLQRTMSGSREWEHLMPIEPSVQAGSSMFIGKPLETFTVAAARQCASPYNHNEIVGRRANAKAYLSPKAVPLFDREEADRA